MIEIFLGACLGFVVSVVGLRMALGIGPSRNSYREAVAYGLVVCLAAGLNFEFGVFAQKDASQFAFDLFHGRESARGNQTFLIQAILNAPGYVITETWWVAIGTNIGIAAGTLAYARRFLGSGAWVFYAPAVVNFLLFALRDPLIGLMMLGLAVSLVRAADLEDWIPRKKELSLAGALLFSRPEAALIYGAARAGQLAHSVKGRKARLLLIPVGVGALIMFLSVAPRAIGIEDSGGVGAAPTVLNDTFVQRAGRNVGGFGSGSDILGGALKGLPVVLRYPVQLVTFFILPLPWEIRSFEHALAALDSAFFAIAFVAFWRRAPRPLRGLMVLYVLGIAFFAHNYGNLFRLRMPAYFIIMAAFRSGAADAQSLRGESGIEQGAL